MKRIVFVSNHLSGGGSERVLTSLANEFNRKGYEVSIIAYDSSESYPVDIEIQVIEIGQGSNLIKQAYRTQKACKKIRPDVVIAFEYFVNLATIIACRKMKVNLIVSERNDPAKVGAGRLKDILRNFLYRFCDTLVCQTPDAKKYFPADIQKNSVVIPNPVKNDLPKRWDKKREKEIVCFCRLNSQKNLPLLIDAFKLFSEIHPEYKLAIFGNGPEKSALERYIVSQKLVGKVNLFPSRTDIHERVARSAMFVSTSDYEGLSNSMIEALAIGLPTICTDCPCGGAKMMIENGINGFLVPVGDVNKLVSVMLKIAEDEVLSESISVNASKLKEEISLEKISFRWEALFTK